MSCNTTYNNYTTTPLIFSLNKKSEVFFILIYLALIIPITNSKNNNMYDLAAAKPQEMDADVLVYCTIIKISF